MAWIRMPMRKKFEKTLIENGYLTDDFAEYCSITPTTCKHQSDNYYGLVNNGTSTDAGSPYNWTHDINLTFDESVIGKRCDIEILIHQSARTNVEKALTFTYNGITENLVSYYNKGITRLEFSFIVTDTSMRLYNRFRGTSVSWSPAAKTGICNLTISNKKVSA